MLAALLSFVLLADGSAVHSMQIMTKEQCIEERDARFASMQPLLQSGEAMVAAFRCQKIEGGEV